MAPKIIAVVGVTGNQGSSVAETFLQDSDWKVRGITRDPSKPTSTAWASRGVEVVAGDLDVPGTMEEAFRGASVIFGTTDFVQHMYDPKINAEAAAQGRPANELATEREFEQAKALIDAAATHVSTIDRFVLSTLSHTTRWSGGKITYNLHFDCKWKAVEYLKEKYPELWKKTSLLQLGIFTSNWKAPYYTPKKQEDGSFIVTLPMSGEKKFPIIDPNADTGNLTKALVEIAPGANLVGASSLTNWNEWCEIWSKVNKVKCTFVRLGDKALEEAIGPIGKEITAMFQYMDEFGYDGSDPSVVYPWDLKVEVKLSSLESYLEKQDWSSIL